ncbi:MAG: hypothetical protein LAO24_03490 [Acidobacteriia bacterium]|nr:hypothetical protein [Terriglobia bacterium]
MTYTSNMDSAAPGTERGFGLFANKLRFLDGWRRLRSPCGRSGRLFLGWYYGSGVPRRFSRRGCDRIRDLYRGDLAPKLEQFTMESIIALNALLCQLTELLAEFMLPP